MDKYLSISGAVHNTRMSFSVAQIRMMHGITEELVTNVSLRRKVLRKTLDNKAWIIVSWNTCCYYSSKEKTYYLFTRDIMFAVHVKSCIRLPLLHVLLSSVFIVVYREYLGAAAFPICFNDAFHKAKSSSSRLFNQMQIGWGPIVRARV